MDLSPQHLHALHIGMLSFHISGTHEHLTFHVHQGTYRCCGNPMLSRTSLGDDTRLTHSLRHQDLSDGVIDLMSSRMVQVLAFQIQLTAVFLTHPTGIIQR